MTIRYLAGQHALVTGAGRGIGAAVALELARLGAKVTLLGRDMRRLEEHARRVAAAHGVETTGVQCDVSDESAVAAAFAAARDRFGSPAVLVNNAGHAEAAPLVETSRELWDRTLAVNLTGAFLCIRQVLPAMIATRAGRIVNVASVAGLRGAGRVAAYSASKHGLIGLTRSVALEVASLGITVNAVCPGYTDTDMARKAVDNLMKAGRSEEEARAMIMRTIPRGSLIRPEEVASTIGWLCSPEASAITGQAIAVAGGEG